MDMNVLVQENHYIDYKKQCATRSGPVLSSGACALIQMSGVINNVSYRKGFLTNNTSTLPPKTQGAVLYASSLFRIRHPEYSVA